MVFARRLIIVTMSKKLLLFGNKKIANEKKSEEKTENAQFKTSSPNLFTYAKP